MMGRRRGAWSDRRQGLRPVSGGAGAFTVVATAAECLPISNAAAVLGPVSPFTIKDEAPAYRYIRSHRHLPYAGLNQHYISWNLQKIIIARCHLAVSGLCLSIAQ